MGDTRQIEKYILIKAEHPSLDDVEVCRQAGYSEKRLHVQASNLRRNSRVQAKLAAIRNQQLSATPTLQTYHCELALASQGAERGDANAWIHLRIAEHYARELAQQPQEQQDKPVVVRVDFVESQLPPEQVQTVNKFLGQFEASAGLPEGWSGRLTTPVEAKQPEPRPVEQKGKAKPAKEEDGRWLRCEQHGKFWNVASCPSCDALQWQDRAYRAAAVN